MGIGLSNGAFYRDEGHYQASMWDDRYDDNIVSPQELKDRQDYPVPTLAKDTMPFPDNKNPDSTFDSRFGTLPPSGILNDLKKPTGETVPLIRKISNDLVPPNKMGITDQDIDKAMDIGMAFSGGGLSTRLSKAEKSLSEVMAPHEVKEIMEQYKQIPFREGDYFIKHPSTVGTAVDEAPKFQSYMDMFLEKSVNTIKENPKTSIKDNFLRAVKDTHEAFKSDFEIIVNKLKTALLESVKEPVPTTAVDKKAMAKGYEQPAYRGIKTESPSSVHTGFTLYSTESPLLADMYSSYLSKHPGFKVPEGSFLEGAQVMPLYINTKNYHYFDAKGKHWTEANGKAIEEARNAGKPGVIVDKVWDEPNSTNALGEAKKIFITFQEGLSTVKSRFAKEFNPESKDMLHGIGVGGPAGYISYEAVKDLSDGN